jgi:tetratricopeptide (TPR) repeat protein
MDQARWELYFKLGMDAYAQSDWDQARQAFEVALEEAQQVEVPDLRLARSLNNLAVALSQLGRVGESVVLQERALDVSRELFGPDHEIVAGGLLNLAADYAKMQRLVEAERIFHTALERLRAAGNTGLEAQGLENLSQFYMAHQKMPQAAETLERLIELMSEDQEGQARVLHTLTHVYDALGKTPQADSCRQRTVALIEKLWGPGSMAFGEVAGNMAESLMAQQRFPEAAELYARAGTALAACVPPDDPRLLGCLLGQLISLREGGLLGEAEKLGARMAEEWRSLPRPPGDYRRWLNEYGLAVFLQHRHEEAARLFEESMTVGGDMPPPTRISILFNLGSARMAAGDLASAQQILENLSVLAEEHLTGDHQLTWRIWLQLTELYRASGQQELLAATQEKLDRHTKSL